MTNPLADIEAARGRVTYVQHLGDARRGTIYTTIMCGLDTPAGVALAAAGLDPESVEVSLGHHRSNGGGLLSGWVWTVVSYLAGARSSLATGCLEVVA
jgi:hypothetical protein